MDPRDPLRAVRRLLGYRDRARAASLPPARLARVEGYVDGYLTALLRAGQVTRAEIGVVQATAHAARARRSPSQSGELAIDLRDEDVIEIVDEPLHAETG